MDAFWEWHPHHKDAVGQRFPSTRVRMFGEV